MADFDPDTLLTAPPPASAMMKVRPNREPLTRDQAEKLVRKYNPDITTAAVQGEVDNLMRESSGKSAASGDYTHGRPTSFGLYQEHNTRNTALQAYAKQHGVDPSDPDIQVQYARLEKERDYPSLLKLQQSTTDRNQAEDAFKRIFERPASVLWQNNANGEPVLDNDRYRYSDRAMREHDGRDDTDMMYMSPSEYLDLTPVMEKPFDTPAGRALQKSVDRGDKIESVPTLDVSVDGPTATVTDQDGRHRALMAQKEGLDAIPVAVRKTGNGDPKEIVGTNGNVQAFDYPKVNQPTATQEQPEQPKEPISLLSQIGEAIIPKAEAAEPKALPSWMSDAVPASPQKGPGTGSLPDWMSDAVPAGGQTQDQEKPGWFDDPVGAGVSLAKGAAKGFGDTVFAGQELLGKGMEAVGIPGGQALTEDARDRMKAEAEKIAPNQAAHPYATGFGDLLGSIAIPGMGEAGAARLGLGALKTAAVGGGLGGLLTPGGDDKQFWRDKMVGAGTGAVAGAGAGAAGNMLSKAFAPTLKPNVDLLVNEGVQLTPGQLAGGKLKRAEDILVSHPIVGNQVIQQVRKSIETFNRAAINRGLADIGQKLPDGLNSGHDAIGKAQDLFKDAYDQVIPRMVGRLDNGLQNDLTAIYSRAQAGNLPKDQLDQLRHTITQHILEPFRLGGGQLTGSDAQKIGTMLDSLINPLRQGNVYEQDLGRYMREADKALDAMLARQNPILQAAKDKIDKGYAQFKTVQRAAAMSDQASGGTFTPAQLRRAVKARDFSKDKGNFARGDAMMEDLANAGGEVLPSKVPNSGTIERGAFLSMLGGGAAGLHLLSPEALAAAGVLSTPYTAPGSWALNAAVKRLSQTAPGPTRNALASLSQLGGRALAPAAGAGVAGLTPPPQQ